jgi:hypothetical protein
VWSAARTWLVSSPNTVEEEINKAADIAAKKAVGWAIVKADVVLTGAAEALTAFKDWSNYLLVTTVVALGWIASDTAQPDVWRWASAWALCLSIIFGIFTLALVPLVREEIPRNLRRKTSDDLANMSIFRLAPKFRLFWIIDKPQCCASIKFFCWPQHLSFILGVVLYTIAKVGFVSARAQPPTPATSPAVIAPPPKPSTPPASADQK